MAPVSPSRLAELADAARRRLGSTAHFATGDDVPGAIAPPVGRRPATEMLPTRMHAQSMPVRDFESLAAKAASNPAALSVEEVLILLDAGADPALVMPQVPLTAAQRDDIIRRVQRGEAITPGEIDRLRQTPAAEQAVDAPAVEPDAPAVDVATGEARPFADVGGGKLVGEDGMPVTALDDGEHFVYADGTVVDVMGTVVGRQSPGALEDVASTDVDNLAASAMEIAEEGDAPRGGTRNLTPKTAKPDALAQLGQSIFQITTPTDLESVSQQTLKSLLRRAQQYRLPDGKYDPKFLASINRDPAYAAGRLAALEQMAGVSNADRAAEQIDTAAQAVAASNTPRPPAGNRPAALADVEAARQLVAESLPEGDWAALTDAFNRLDDEQRSAVLAALPLETRKFLSGMMDPSQQTPAFLPNRVSESLRPVNDVDDLVAQREAARLAGNQEEVDAINEVLQGANAAPQEDIVEAIRVFNERRAAADRLRSAMIARNELVQPEIDRMRQAFTPQPQPAAATPGARTPEFAAEDVPDAEMPTAYDEALAAANEARVLRDRRAPGGGATEEERAAAVGAENLRGAPLALKGRDGVQPPMESRSRGERGIEGNDTRAVAKSLKLQQSIDAAQSEVDAALEAAKSASGVAALAQASKQVKAAQEKLAAAYKAMDDAYPARLVNSRTGEAKPAPAGMLSGEVKVPAGWTVERGRRAMSDSRLNMGGQQETFDETLMAAIGFRPRADRSLSRSSTDLTGQDVSAMNAEAGRVFGDDAAELLDGDFDPDWGVGQIDLETTGAPKKTRRGGQQQNSRVEQAMQTLFQSKSGDVNPLTLKGDDGNPLFANADEVAEDILSRNTIFKPGTANYEMAKQRLSGLIDQRYNRASADQASRDIQAAIRSANGGDLNDFDGVDEALRAAEGGDTSPIQPVESSNVTDNLEASAVAVDDTPAADAAKPKGRRGKKASAKKEDVASPAADGDSPVQPVTGNQKSVEEIQAEANQVEAQARREALDSGMSKPEADKAARKARKAHVDAEMAARGGTKPAARQPVKMTVGEVLDAARKGGAETPDATVKPVTGGDTKPVGDASAKPAPAADATPNDAAANAADPTVKSVDGDGKPVDAGGKKADSNNGKSGKPDGGNAPEKKKGSLLKKAVGGTALVGAGLIGGGIALDRLSSGGGGGQDGGWRLPPGAGGPPGGPDVFPIPVGAGGDGSSLMGEEAPMTEEERITDALARLRRARAMNTEGPSQTVLNYHAGWR